MLRSWQFWSLTAIASLAAGLMVANMWAFSLNRKLQTEVNLRAQFIQQSAQLEQLTRDIATALAQLGARNQDEQIRVMLASLGITFSVSSSPAPTAPAQAPAGGKR